MEARPSESAPRDRSPALAVLFALVVATVSVLYLLPSNVHISVYAFIDRHVGLKVGLVAISNLVHLSSFALLGLLAVAAFPARYLPPAGLAVFAVLIEGLQEFVPHRSGNLEDLRMNLAGLAAGLALAMALRAIRRTP
ncbi:MAG: VanZ family protein [Thermodesulfovibrionales bacterium]|nr:VanZ family protein [Thermodesulfovibrionales bacterium]